MVKRRVKPEWLLLVHQLPQKPTKLRVHVWRRLRALGAVSIKNSVYVLPNNEKTNEDFQWLRQEIESSGGEANLFRAGSVEGATDQEIIEAFRKERDEDYAKLISELDGLGGAVREQIKGNSLSPAKLAQYQGEISKLRLEIDRLTAIDFFQSARSSDARAAFEKCRRALQATDVAKGSAKEADAASLRTADYQRRRWVTRKDPHIDRLASAWLIRRFIDRRSRFFFIAEGEQVEGALTFDMAEGDFTHRGDDCTFETLIQSFALEPDRALADIAQIVHDIDLKDNKFGRPEAPGIRAVVRGLATVYRDDSERLKESLTVFDALYEEFRKDTDVRA
jgi:hypothetical protein